MAKARIHVSLSLPNGGRLDEADIALIETIHKCRSILGASKFMGFSYRKTWLMTACEPTFQTKVVETFPEAWRRRRSHRISASGLSLSSALSNAGPQSAAAAALGELTASLSWSFEAEEAGEAQEAHTVNDYSDPVIMILS